MEYNPTLGLELMGKYLNTEHLQKRLEHSRSVGEFAFKVASRIGVNNPELNISPELISFLGYAHDIGYHVREMKHELHTIDILVREGVPKDIAEKTMHGQMAEQFGEKDGKDYLPKGLEGIILVYCDASVRIGEPISIEDRLNDIEARVNANNSYPEELKNEILFYARKCQPRMKRYESIVLNLANAGSFKDF